MKLKFLLLIVLLVSSSALWAQSLTVSGTVKDTDGEDLIGVAVTVKGSSRGTVTDVNGRFTIEAGSQSTLTFSYLGYKSQDAKASSSPLNIILEGDDQALEEILVVAYRTASKDSYTGSASSLKKDAIEKSQVSSISRVLQGDVPGVQSVASSGQPGTNATILIRGVGSINASSNPLYVVDGAPFDGDVNTINPSDIESITVLKDAASSSLYGSRGANGVIIITTKQGKKDQKPRIDLKMTYGSSSRAMDGYEHVSTNEYFQLYWEALRNQEHYVNGKSLQEAATIASSKLVGNLGINPYGTKYPQPIDTNGNLVAGATPLWDDNWTENYDQDAHRFEAIANISGGSKSSDYFISVGYLDDQGIGISSGFERITGRVKLNTEIKPWFNLSTNVSLTHSVQDYPKADDATLNNSIFFASLMPSFYPIWQRNWDDGSFLLDQYGNRMYDYGENYRPSSANPKWNHLGSVPYNINEIKRDVASIRTAAEFKIYEGLKFKTSFNLDYTNRNDHYYVNPTYGTGKDYGGSVSKSNALTTGMTVNNILTYDLKVKEKHDIKLLAGQEYYEFNTTNMEGSRQNFVLPDLYEPVAASQLNDFTGLSDKYKLLSFFSNAEYGYDNKYYFSASVRTDGSSRFSSDSRWGVFWSTGASWRIINESFTNDLSWLSNLTLRASYGGQGNDNLGTYYAYKALYAVENNLGEPGVVTSRLPTPDLKWETNLNFNAGLDFGFFKNRLSGTFEFFDRRSKDLLFEVPKPPSLGYGAISANVGSMKNVGFEFSVKGVPVETKQWKWDISVNATHFKNTITSLPQEQIISGTKRLIKGGSIYDFFLVEWAGIDPKDGLPQWYKTDTNGNRVTTKVYNEANTTSSKTVVGSSLPDLVGGFSSNLTYRDFDFSFLFAYSIGGKIYNQDQTYLMNTGTGAGRAMKKEIANRWTPENPDANVPRMQTTSTSWTSQSSRLLVDASYMRLKNITLGYNIPKHILNKASIQNCKVYVQGENLLTVFDGDGMDPEQAANGVSYFRYPAMKTISLGLNLSF